MPHIAEGTGFLAGIMGKQRMVHAGNQCFAVFAGKFHLCQNSLHQVIRNHFSGLPLIIRRISLGINHQKLYTGFRGYDIGQSALLGVRICCIGWLIVNRIVFAVIAELPEDGTKFRYRNIHVFSALHIMVAVDDKHRDSGSFHLFQFPVKLFSAFLLAVVGQVSGNHQHLRLVFNNLFDCRIHCCCTFIFTWKSLPAGESWPPDKECE